MREYLAVGVAKSKALASYRRECELHHKEYYTRVATTGRTTNDTDEKCVYAFQLPTIGKLLRDAVYRIHLAELYKRITNLKHRRNYHDY